MMPLYATSPSARFKSCSRVFTTSNGFTANAEVAPAPMPARKEHQNTASPISDHNSYQTLAHILLNAHFRTVFSLSDEYYVSLIGHCCAVHLLKVNKEEMSNCKITYNIKTSEQVVRTCPHQVNK